LRQLAEYYFTRTESGAKLAAVLKLDVTTALKDLDASGPARYM
jgi:hypothetical protein